MDRETKRLLKQAERDNRIDLLYRSAPRLKELDQAVNEAGRQALVAVYQGRDGQAERQRLKELQAEKLAELAACSNAVAEERE